MHVSPCSCAPALVTAAGASSGHAGFLSSLLTLVKLRRPTAAEGGEEGGHRHHGGGHAGILPMPGGPGPSSATCAVAAAEAEATLLMLREERRGLKLATRQRQRAAAAAAATTTGDGCGNVGWSKAGSKPESGGLWRQLAAWWAGPGCPVGGVGGGAVGGIGAHLPYNMPSGGGDASVVPVSARAGPVARDAYGTRNDDGDHAETSSAVGSVMENEYDNGAAGYGNHNHGHTVGGHQHRRRPAPLAALRWDVRARARGGIWAAAPSEAETRPPPTPFGVRHLHRGSSPGNPEAPQLAAAAAVVAPRRGMAHRSAPRDEGLGAPMDVFDRHLKSLHRDRSAALLDVADPLLAAVSERLLDRLEDCRRSFPTAVVLGGAALPVLHQLAGGRAGIERVVVVDSSQDMLDRVQREAAESRCRPGARPWPRVLCVRGDEEHLPLQPASVDLIISCLGLHWANDLPGAMAQCRLALVPDGLFLSALLGGDTLQELRISCALAQMEREGGRVGGGVALAQVRDAGNLLTRADLRLPAVDVDRFNIGYPSPLELVQHLRALGESNAAVQRRRSLSRDSALAAAAVYQSLFGSEEAGRGGCVTATFEVIFMTGWAPAPHQPKAAKRGSATLSFQELADGLVKEGAAVGGSADEGIIVGGTSAGPGAEGEGEEGEGEAGGTFHDRFAAAAAAEVVVTQRRRNGRTDAVSP